MRKIHDYQSFGEETAAERIYNLNPDQTQLKIDEFLLKN